MPTDDIDPDGGLRMGTRPRVLAWLARQVEPRHLGAIARGAGVSRESARTRLRELADEGRVTVVRGGTMSGGGPVGDRYALTALPEVRVSVRLPDQGGGWWEPNPDVAAVFALRALADARTLTTIGGAEGVARIRAALDELDEALTMYPGGERTR